MSIAESIRMLSSLFRSIGLNFHILAMFFRFACLCWSLIRTSSLHRTTSVWCGVHTYEYLQYHYCHVDYLLVWRCVSYVIWSSVELYWFSWEGHIWAFGECCYFTCYRRTEKQRSLWHFFDPIWWLWNWEHTNQKCINLTSRLVIYAVMNVFGIRGVLNTCS